jgi:hypothetical protein
MALGHADALPGTSWNHAGGIAGLTPPLLARQACNRPRTTAPATAKRRKNIPGKEYKIYIIFSERGGIVYLTEVSVMNKQ